MLDLTGAARQGVDQHDLEPGAVGPEQGRSLSLSPTQNRSTGLGAVLSQGTLEADPRGVPYPKDGRREKLQRVWLNLSPLPNPKPVSGATR